MERGEVGIYSERVGDGVIQAWGVLVVKSGIMADQKVS